MKAQVVQNKLNITKFLYPCSTTFDMSAVCICYVVRSIQEEKEAIAREKKMKADAKKKAEAERIARMVSGHTVYLGCNSS